MIKCECGLTYVPGSVEEEANHNKWHDEYLNGPLLSDLNGLPGICTLDNFPLVVVDAKVPDETRLRLSKAANVAQRTMDFPAGYDGIITEEDQKMFLAKDNGRAIGMVITGLDSPHWHLGWAESGGVQLVNETPHCITKQRISRVWVAKNYRRKGIASSMIAFVAEFLGYKIKDIGWELPLSQDGKALVRKMVPEKWWGRGDGYALGETLESS